MRPFALLAALADAGTQLRRTDDAAVRGEVECRRHLRRDVSGAEAKIVRQRRRIDDLAGIEDVLRIEGPLDFAESLVKHRAEHFLLKRTADQPVAMFAGEGAAVFQHQVGHVCRDGLEIAGRRPSVFRLTTGRTCKQPTEAWA